MDLKMTDVVFSKIAAILEILSEFGQNLGLGIFPSKLKKLLQYTGWKPAA